MDFHGNSAHHIGYGHPRLIEAPLTITNAEMDTALDILNDCLAEEAAARR